MVVYKTNTRFRGHPYDPVINLVFRLTKAGKRVAINGKRSGAAPSLQSKRNPENKKG